MPPANWKKDGAATSLTQADIDKIGEDFPAFPDDKPPTTTTTTGEVTSEVTKSEPAPAEKSATKPAEETPKEPEVLPVMDGMPSFPTEQPKPAETETAQDPELRPTVQGEALLDPVVKENQQSGEGKEDANLNI